MFLWLLLLLSTVTCKRYIMIPQESLQEARRILCEITADYQAAQPQHTHHIPICLPVTHASTDVQRALARYRDQLREKYYKVSYETQREFQQKIHNYGYSPEGYDNHFCIDTEKSREIHVIELKCTM